MYFIVVGIFLLLISGSFLSEGLSRVGLDNAVVSQRMAEGFEDFWLPSLTTPGTPDRSNYLPLGYWIESRWFALFGDDSFQAEKVYSLLTYLIIGLLIVWIWHLIGQARSVGWLPLLCWITIPIVSWSATNNLLESTMTIFILLSVVFLIKGGKASFVAGSRLALGKSANGYRLSRTAWVVLAAVMMELAFMIKGFGGLFPIFFPFLYWLMVRRERPLFPLFSTGVILAVWMVTLFVVIISSPDVYHHLYNYLHHQMIGGVLHVQTVTSRFYILYALLVQGAIPLTILLIFCLLRLRTRPFYHFMFYWKYRDRLTADQLNRSRQGWFFLAMGMAGILPIMLGLKQQEFYIVPTLPFFAIAMSCLIYDLIEDWLLRMDRVAQRVLVGLACLIFGSGLLLNLNSIHRTSLHNELLSDMRYILPCLQQGETLRVTHEVMDMPEVAEYFYRYKDVVLDTASGNHLLTSNGHLERLGPDDAYVRMDLPTSRYKLYEYDPLPLDTVAVGDTLNFDDELYEEL